MPFNIGLKIFYKNNNLILFVNSKRESDVMTNDETIHWPTCSWSLSIIESSCDISSIVLRLYVMWCSLSSAVAWCAELSPSPAPSPPDSSLSGLFVMTTLTPGRYAHLLNKIALKYCDILRRIKRLYVLIRYYMLTMILRAPNVAWQPENHFTSTNQKSVKITGVIRNRILITTTRRTERKVMTEHRLTYLVRKFQSKDESILTISI